MSSHCFHLGTHFSHFLPLCSGSPDSASTISSAVSAESEGRLHPTPGFNRQLGSFPFLILLHFLPLSTLKLYFLPILPSLSGHLISLAVMLLPH